MSTTRDSPEPAAAPPFRLRFQLVHVFYAMALLASALATFGGGGLAISVPILAFWAGVFGSRSRPQALRIGCLLVLLGGCLISLMLPAIQSASEAARRTQNAQIGDHPAARPYQR